MAIMCTNKVICHEMRKMLYEESLWVVHVMHNAVLFYIESKQLFFDNSDRFETIFANLKVRALTIRIHWFHPHDDYDYAVGEFEALCPDVRMIVEVIKWTHSVQSVKVSLVYASSYDYNAKGQIHIVFERTMAFVGLLEGMYVTTKKAQKVYIESYPPLWYLKKYPAAKARLQGF